MQTKFENYDAVGLLDSFKNDLGVQLDTSCQRTELYLPKKIGKGVISTYLFRDGLSLFHFNGTLYQDWEWKFDCKEDSPLFVFFSLSGNIEDVEIGKKDNFVLQPLETLVLVQPGGVGRSAIFSKGELINLAILRIDKKKYFNKKGCCPDDLPNKMRALISSSGKVVRCLLPSGKYTADVVRIINEIQTCPHKGLIRTCFIEAKSREWLALLMQQIEERSNEQNRKYDPSKSNHEKVKSAKEYLLNDLQNPPTILQLSRQVGLNQQQLKVDFKYVFGKSIYQFLVAERMKLAKELLGKSDMAILIIAEKVGYQNAGHFAKKFREHHGLLPSQYQRMMRRVGQEN